MADKPLCFALFGNEYQSGRLGSIQRVLAFLKAREAKLYVERLFYDYLVSTSVLEKGAVSVFDTLPQDVDFVIALGGDGTFLRAASRIGARQTPILGINMGRLGFLADTLPTEAEEALEAIYEGDFCVEDRTCIGLSIEGEPLEGYPYALNEIAILKRDNASMISIRASINGEYLVTYQADGLIVSTPTGSTAYSLSNGGPIIVPQTGVLCLSPVAPHSLSIRPIVIDNSSEITLEVKSRSHNFLVAIDGRSEKHREGVRITIKKAPYVVRVLKKTGRRYFSTLREKMMWGADTRD